MLVDPTFENYFSILPVYHPVRGYFDAYIFHMAALSDDDMDFIEDRAYTAWGDQLMLLNTDRLGRYYLLTRVDNLMHANEIIQTFKCVDEQTSRQHKREWSIAMRRIY